MRGVDVLIIDGLRDLPHPTHLNVQGAIEAARIVGAKQTYLTHQDSRQKSRPIANATCPPASAWSYDGMKLEFDLT